MQVNASGASGPGTLVDALHAAARRWPDRVAWTFDPGERFTFADVARLTGGYHRAPRGRGQGAAPRVGAAAAAAGRGRARAPEPLPQRGDCCGRDLRLGLGLGLG